MKLGLNDYLHWLLLYSFCLGLLTMSVQQITVVRRTRENFDFNWQFHKGDIAMKKMVKAGGKVA